MAIPAIIHLVGEDAIYGELDEVPNPTHHFLFLRNVRKKDGKPLGYLMDGAEVFLYAWHKVTFVEIMENVSMGSTMSHAQVGAGVATSNQAAKPAGTTVLGFFRDDE
jgi:hypothetical protein